MSDHRFPSDFVWGAATASYQVEGSPLSEGAGRSIWHDFSHTPGTTYRGDTGDRACDHFHRYQEDIKLMKWMGLKAYRFSIAWPRIIPEGQGHVNEKGLDFYERLVDGLIEAGITPYPTLYHWDLPSELQNVGGWANREIAGWFADYADVVFRRLGDRVKHWMTLNEPAVTAFLGHLTGDFAPGVKSTWMAGRTVHHQLLAHARVVDALRAVDGGGEIGIALSNGANTPASQDEADVEAARTANELQNYPLWLEPIIHGRYSERALQAFGSYLPEGFEEDMEQIKRPLDFVGINYYFRAVVRADADSPMGSSWVEERDVPRTAMGWEIYPDGLHEILTGVATRYPGLPVYVTENGAAFDDELTGDEVNDQGRTDYLRGHFVAAHQAIEDGVPLKGYFVWSFMDNFEWAHGYSKRFGLIYVDYSTQRRVPKGSAKWYRSVIEANGLRSEA